MELLREHLRKSDLLVKVTRINKDLAVWNGFCVKGRIRMPPGVKLCAPQFTYHISVWSPSMVCSVNKGFAGVCVYVYLCVFFPPVYSARWAVPMDCAHTISYANSWSGTNLWTGDLVFKLSRTFLKNLFLHSQDCCEGLDWHWLWVSSYL